MRARSRPSLVSERCLNSSRRWKPSARRWGGVRWQINSFQLACGGLVTWCVGQVVERNTVDGERVKVNFFIFYEIDQQTVKKVLRLDDYDSEWVLLASLDQG